VPEIPCKPPVNRILLAQHPETLPARKMKNQTLTPADRLLHFVIAKNYR
jgi:hypothetical protein